MTAYVYTVENRKGGVAKTTTAVTLAAGLAQRLEAVDLGERVAGRRVAVSMDGGRIRLREKKRGPKTSKGRNRYHGAWREPKLLIVYVVDAEGKKMSKSIGNVVAPKTVINKYGAEILRMWVSASDYRDDVRISDNILKQLSDAYRRIRNTSRFLLGNLNDFSPETDNVPVDQMLDIDRFAAGVLALSLFEGSYASEIYRAGIVAVNKGQWEASYTLGLGTYQSYRYIILPQAFQRILPPLAGQFVSLIKDSSIVSVISIQELTFQGMELMAATYLTFEIWITIAVLYFILTYSCSMMARVLERSRARLYVGIQMDRPLIKMVGP